MQEGCISGKLSPGADAAGSGSTWPSPELPVLAGWSWGRVAEQGATCPSISGPRMVRLGGRAGDTGDALCAHHRLRPHHCFHPFPQDLQLPPDAHLAQSQGKRETQTPTFLWLN